MSFLVLLGIIAVVAFYAISIYNGLVTSRNGY
ncbi:MAG: LemA family protein, partial [Rhodanobacteraceae bacterium]|nr:LemA family protein [Rhodanobacteraceae bacterium]